jgi:hypothetical protein
MWESVRQLRVNCVESPQQEKIFEKGRTIMALTSVLPPSEKVPASDDAAAAGEDVEASQVASKAREGSIVVCVVNNSASGLGYILLLR